MENFLANISALSSRIWMFCRYLLCLSQLHLQHLPNRSLRSLLGCFSSTWVRFLLSFLMLFLCFIFSYTHDRHTDYFITKTLNSWAAPKFSCSVLCSSNLVAFNACFSPSGVASSIFFLLPLVYLALGLKISIYCTLFSSENLVFSFL